MPEEIVADDLAEGGKLRQIMPRWHGTPMSVYAITETRLLPAKTQRFIEFLRERLRREQAYAPRLPPARSAFPRSDAASPSLASADETPYSPTSSSGGSP